MMLARFLHGLVRAQYSTLLRSRESRPRRRGARVPAFVCPVIRAGHLRYRTDPNSKGKPAHVVAVCRTVGADAIRVIPAPHECGNARRHRCLSASSAASEDDDAASVAIDSTGNHHEPGSAPHPPTDHGPSTNRRPPHHLHRWHSHPRCATTIRFFKACEAMALAIQHFGEYIIEAREYNVFEGGKS